MGGDIGYSDLSFSVDGDDLGARRRGLGKHPVRGLAIRGSGNRSVVNLQMVVEAMAEFSPGGADPLLDNKVEQFDFAGLVEEFDEAVAVNPAR